MMFPAHFRPNDLCQICKHRGEEVCRKCTRDPIPRRDLFEEDEHVTNARGKVSREGWA